MIGSKPQILFPHDWGRSPAGRLATDFEAALDQLGKEQHSEERVGKLVGCWSPHLDLICPLKNGETSLGSSS
jgi:hypothetical protein